LIRRNWSRLFENGVAQPGVSGGGKGYMRGGGKERKDKMGEHFQKTEIVWGAPAREKECMESGIREGKNKVSRGDRNTKFMEAAIQLIIMGYIWRAGRV